MPRKKAKRGTTRKATATGRRPPLGFAKGGRPTRLTVPLMRKMVRMIASGSYMETVAAYSGVGRSTLYEWLRKGAEDTSGVYADFHAAVTQAVAASEIHDVEIVGRAASSDWKAAAWRLARRFPERYGTRAAVQLGVMDSSQSLLKSAEADLSEMSVEDLESLERIHAKYLKPEGPDERADPEPTDE